MTFTDEDLKQLKEEIATFGLVALKAIIARLEAAESLLGFSDGHAGTCAVWEEYRGTPLTCTCEAWRKAAGK